MRWQCRSCEGDRHVTVPYGDCSVSQCLRVSHGASLLAQCRWDRDRRRGPAMIIIGWLGSEPDPSAYGPGAGCLAQPGRIRLRRRPGVRDRQLELNSGGVRRGGRGSHGLRRVTATGNLKLTRAHCALRQSLRLARPQTATACQPLPPPRPPQLSSEAQRPRRRLSRS